VALVAPTVVPTGANPVTNGLILYLDATRSASYAGTGSTWYDLSTQNNTATLYGSPIYNDRPASLTFANNKYALTSNLISSISTNATFIAWINPSETQITYTSIILSRDGFSGATADATGLSFFEYNSIGYVWKGIRDTYEWSSNIRVPNTQWSMVALTISSSKATVYLCNSSGPTRSAEKIYTHPALNGDVKFYVGVDPFDIINRAFNGKIATSMVYSSALTKADIESIYNAQKIAFGL
jgi:hypothetical protein